MAEFAKYRAPDGEVIETGPRLVEVLRRRYFTLKDYVRYCDEGLQPAVIMGEEYGAGTALSVVDPEKFWRFYEEMLEYLVYADSDDWICTLGFRPITDGPRGGLRNAKPKAGGSRGSASRTSGKKTPAKKATSRPASRRY